MTVSIADSENQEYVYGPVPSRRLGRSLGVDLVPFKTCTYDCIYCQLGRTTNKTTQRKEWAPSDRITDQVKASLESRPDYITLSGSGEPTLHSKIEKIIFGIKTITDVPIAVLTNGSLLWVPEVRSSLMGADLVVPSLDAGTVQLFKYVNRPHPEVTFSKMLEGLVKFREEYSGKYWLEAFFLGGVTTVEAQVNTLSHCINMIGPDKVQINTVTRPPAEDFAEAVPAGQLKVIAGQLYKNAEVIADYDGVHKQRHFSVRRDNVLTLLKRRPCRVEDIAAGLGLHQNEVLKYLEELSSQGRIEARARQGHPYYKVPT